MDDCYLEHHGILGMKWGVRRSQEELDRLAGRWREKQTKKNEKRFDRKLRKYNKIMTKLSSQEETSETKLEKEKAEKKYGKIKEDYKRKKEAINRITTDDYVRIKDKEKARRKVMAKSLAVSTASLAAGGILSAIGRNSVAEIEAGLRSAALTSNSIRGKDRYNKHVSQTSGISLDDFFNYYGRTRMDSTPLSYYDFNEMSKGVGFNNRYINTTNNPYRRVKPRTQQEVDMWYNMFDWDYIRPSSQRKKR